jgi:hypothetical protein
MNWCLVSFSEIAMATGVPEISGSLKKVVIQAVCKPHPFLLVSYHFARIQHLQFVDWKNTIKNRENSQHQTRPIN